MANVIVISSDDSSGIDEEEVSCESDELELQGLMDEEEEDEGSLSECEQPQRMVQRLPAQSQVVGNTNYYRAVSSDVVSEGLQLYMLFLRQEIQRNRLGVPDYFDRFERLMPRNIATFRALADEFSTSSQRDWIRRQAQSVHLHTLNFNTFTDLLVGLFQEGGVTWERIIVLFFFCTDISILALRDHLTHQFQRIQNWTSQFIQDTVCAWVEMEGGWAAVLQQSVNHATRIALLGFCCVGIIALCIYIRNNVSK